MGDSGMLRGKTEAETLRLNGWGIGDILEGEHNERIRRILITVEGEHYERIRRILITAVGEELFLCRWNNGFDGDFGSENGSTTLGIREWKKVGQKGAQGTRRLRVRRGKRPC